VHFVQVYLAEAVMAEEQIEAPVEVWVRPQGDGKLDQRAAHFEAMRVQANLAIPAHGEDQV
jgi:hypothetical protein